MKHLFQKNNGEVHDFWMSYTDLMSAFLVVFIILCAVFYNSYTNKEQEAQIAEQEANLKHKEYQAMIDSMTVVISDMSRDVAQKAAYIDSLEAKDLKNLIKEFETVFVYDSSIKYTIDTDRGSIILTHREQNRDLFPKGKATMQYTLQNYLSKIGCPLVAKAMEINSKRGNKGIEVRIEGHTDPTWDYGSRGTDYGYMRNLELSSARANAVYKYIFENCGLSADQKLFAKKNMISIGYSYSDRVVRGNIYDESEDANSRRIEFRIISK